MTQKNCHKIRSYLLLSHYTIELTFSLSKRFTLFYLPPTDNRVLKNSLNEHKIERKFYLYILSGKEAFFGAIKLNMEFNGTLIFFLKNVFYVKNEEFMNIY